MTPVIFALPFDSTRLLARNRVLREYHDLSKQAALTYRTLVLDNGYFYTEGLEIEDSSGYELVPDEDFQCVGLSGAATSETGFEVCSVIVILNPRVTQEVFINASMVGGKYCDLIPAIADMSAGLLNPTRNVTWKNVEGKPDEFEVGGHMHAMWELYGFEGMVEAINRITTAKLAISASFYQQVQLGFDNKFDVLDNEFNELLTLLAQHLAADNPHRVTKAQVGLSNVENYPIITSVEATTRGFSSRQRYLTVQRFKQMLDVNFIADLNTHIGRTDNPHRVTSYQAGAYSIQDLEWQLADRLDKNAIAVSTYGLEGYNWAALQNYVKTNLNASNIVSGRVNTQRLTLAGGLTAVHGLAGNNQVIDLAAWINAYARRGTEVAYLQGAYGTNIAATLAATMANTTIWPPGALCLVMNYYDGWWDYGNATESRQAWRLQCWVKVDTVNWQPL
ncbi:hypothetical protein D3C85_435030 [compost metagenome]